LVEKESGDKSCDMPPLSSLEKFKLSLFAFLKNKMTSFGIVETIGDVVASRSSASDDQFAVFDFENRLRNRVDEFRDRAVGDTSMYLLVLLI
jgi:hypothetical protein